MSQINISSTPGKLEGIYKKSENPAAPSALLLHPHPLYGGNMHNKVVFLMEKAFLQNGFSTLRFNFRGVENSEGTFDEGHGEIIDASTCCDWLKENQEEDSKLWVAGFSFGSQIALQIMMRRIEVDRFMVLGYYDPQLEMLPFIYPCPTNGLFIHGRKDEIAPIKEAEKVIKKAIRTKDKHVEYQIIENADHFFTSHSDELYNIMFNYIAKETAILNAEKAKE
ncbi:alpha/beta hydrolase [Candidatus Hepatincola sp. Pdp]